MNIVVTTQNAADALSISRTAKGDRSVYWLAMSNAANHGVALISRLGATEAADMLAERRDHYQTAADEARDRGDVVADSYNRGKFAGYHMALTD